jgi:DNA-binding transcriptional regulator YdaS (Cro superfamily)
MLKTSKRRKKMELRDYMHFHRVTCMAMSKDLGIHYMYLSAIKNGKRKAGFELAMKIEKLTGGKVTMKDLRG